MQEILQAGKILYIYTEFDYMALRAISVCQMFIYWSVRRYFKL